MKDCLIANDPIFLDCTGRTVEAHSRSPESAPVASNYVPLDCERAAVRIRDFDSSTGPGLTFDSGIVFGPFAIHRVVYSIPGNRVADDHRRALDEYSPAGENGRVVRDPIPEYVWFAMRLPRD